MKSSLVYFLMGLLVLVGIPTPSQSEATPNILKAKEKAALIALASSNLLLQKAGDGTWPINTKKGTEKATEVGQKGGEKPGGISETGGVLIIVGAVATAIGAILLVAASHSGSC